MTVAQSPAREHPYTVVARRYRPQQFSDLVGQEHVVTALGNAIRQNRVGHAYLFTGARGTGKTSAARIFARCLNCASGPTPLPCGTCEVCQMVATGEDIDVIEIDGASNRGIDEIRELRSNAAVRPSRARYKIYIIDEVHMLTREAFNALLKTLEEPPGHVKFVFCTTDPQKIPITVLSRCQRFDFRPVDAPAIATRLAEIAAAEGVTAHPAALDLLARRAGGSMRDSQSLLEQLLAACDGELTVEKVQSLLGLADLSAIAAIVQQIAAADPGAALARLHAAIADGADAGRIAQQLVGYVRDLMALRTGCDESVLLNLLPVDLPEARGLAERFSLEQLLAILQVLDAAIVQMQSSPHARILLEAALVRTATLGGVQPVAHLLGLLRSGTPSPAQPTAPRPATQPAAAPVPAAPVPAGPAPAARAPSTSDSQSPESQSPPADTSVPVFAPPKEAAAPANPPDAPPDVQPADSPPKKKRADAAPGPDDREAGAIPGVDAGPDVIRQSPAPAPPVGSPDAAALERWWKELTERLEEAGEVVSAGLVGNFKRVDPAGPSAITVTLQREYDQRLCNEDDRKRLIESFLEQVAGRPLRIEFRADPAERPAPPPPAAVRQSRAQLLRQIEQDPLVRAVIEQFGAEITDFEVRPAPSQSPGQSPSRTDRVEHSR